MSGGWLDIEGPTGKRREALAEGLTRLGSSGTEILLSEAGADQLHVWNRPPRMIFLGRGQRPLHEGREFEERALKPGDRVTWLGYVLLYGGEAASADLAPLEELPAPAASSPPSRPDDARYLAWVRAGMLCELGLADAPTAKRWREAVVAGRFEPEACARELLARALPSDAEPRLRDRAGTLLRDFLMAELLAGTAGAKRKARETTRGVAAFLVSQLLALFVFTALIVAALVVLRSKGTSLDALLDRFLPAG